MKNTLAKSNSTKFWICCSAVLMLLGALPAAAQVSGAIYSSMPADVSNVCTLLGPTAFDHWVVNQNLYPTKPCVYLNGGPHNDNTPGILPNDIAYYFQVTDPSGHTLLSTDNAICRLVDINSTGNISGADTISVAAGCAHASLPDVNGGAPVQLIPFADTNNDGGEYKVWLIRSDAATPDADGKHLIFRHGDLKSDNFKVACTSDCGTTSDWPLQGFKFYDANANGVYDGTDTVISNWPMRGIGDNPMIEPAVPAKNYACSNPLDQTTCKYFSAVLPTDANGEFAFAHLTVGGTYGVCEATGTASGFSWIATTQRPVHSNGGTSYETQIFCPRHVKPTFGTSPSLGDELLNSAANDNACLYFGTGGPSDIQVGDVYVNIDPGRGPVEFGNTCVGGGTGALTIGFWSNKNGQALETTADFTALSALNLRNANGSDRDFTGTLSANKTALSSWLLSANATNMAYMLSAQLTAMELNVAHGKVAGSAVVYAGTAPAGCTVAGLSGTGFIAISDLMADANTSLGLHAVTVASGTDRSCQEFMKTTLDKANNNLNFVQSDPTKCLAATTFGDCSPADITKVETGVDTGIGFIPSAASCPAGTTFSTANGGSCVPN